MLRNVLFALLVAMFTVGTVHAQVPTRADSPPPGQGQRQGTPGQGPNAPSHLPPDVLNAPYSGPSTKAPPGLTVPRTPQEAQQANQQLQANPAVQAAQQVSRAAVVAHQALSQRMRGGQLPTVADQAQGKQIPITNARSENPLDGLMRLLTAAEPVAAPDLTPEEQAYFSGFLCFVWNNFYLDRDGRGDEYFGSQGLNYCYPPATNEQVAYIHVSMDIYKCAAYFVTWDICLGEQHWYELWPSCESIFVTYLWCGGGNQAPRAYYPQGLSGAYFLRVFGQVQTYAGGVGSAHVDSRAIPFNCFQGQMVIC
jgi:hypothetical protein